MKTRKEQLAFAAELSRLTEEFGKLANNPPLTPANWRAIKTHCIMTGDILAAMDRLRNDYMQSESFTS